MSISVIFVGCKVANSAALLTSTSIRPKRASVASISRFTALSSLTSQISLATEFAPCCAAISAATVEPSAMSAIITRAPSAASASE